MIDIVEPEIDYSAGLYQKEAKEKIYEINKRARHQLLLEVQDYTLIYFKKITTYLK